MDILWDVDTQNDFCNPDGRLYVNGAQHVKYNQALLVEMARKRKVIHLATADDHEWVDSEISFEPDFKETFPPHCMRGTPGAQKIKATEQQDPVPFGIWPYPARKVTSLIKNERELLILKKNFDVFTNPNIEIILGEVEPDRIFVFGVATDICVKAAVEGLIQRGHSVYFIEDASAGINREDCSRYVSDWTELGIITITTEKALEMLSELEVVDS